MFCVMLFYNFSIFIVAAVMHAKLNSSELPLYGVNNPRFCFSR